MEEDKIEKIDAMFDKIEYISKEIKKRNMVYIGGKRRGDSQKGKMEVPNKERE